MPSSQIIAQVQETRMEELITALMNEPIGDWYFEPQSGTTNDNTIMKMGGDTQYENVKFSDQADPYLYDMEGSVDPTRRVQDSDDATLDHFFSRPIKIAEEEWGTGANLYFQINPWSLYLENPRVANRIANYNLLRCSLRLKLVINGNGFQYGRAISSYLPMDVWDSFSTNAGAVPQDVVQASQLPHVYLDPTTSTGGELKLPFYYYKNYINITESGWSEMGNLTTRSINPLRHANGASDKVTISVFAWIEDVSLSMLTSVESNTLGPQSGTEVDEANKMGMISGPATAVAKAAGILKMIPQIAPFATATEAGATMVAKAAKSLGYCRPPVTADPALFKPRAQSSLALTTVPDGCEKLSVDDKQELSIDPRISGLGGIDSLNIKEIAKRESYLTTFDWNMGTAPETLLWNARVDPVIWAENGLTPNGFHFPACAMAAMPFKYWTGSMKFRFQIVCSAFHKGRLKIVFDPNFLATNEYNTNYLQIIDIADKQDFTIELNNGQATTLLEHHNPGVDSVTQMYSTSTYSSREQGNGVIGVFIVNELTTPNSTVANDIQVNVFVSMGDDFETFVPEDKFQNFVFKPQSGNEGAIVPEAQNTEEPSAPQQESTELIGYNVENHELLNKVYTGECISSFRMLLKRYNLHSGLYHAPNFSPTFAYGRRAMFPYLRGNVTGAVHTTAAGASYNYCNTVLLHWITYAFSGWRGGIRYKFMPRGEISQNNQTLMWIQRAPIGSIEYQQGSGNPPTYSNDSQYAASTVVEAGATPATNKILSGVNGMMFQNGFVNPTAEVELPFYSPVRFVPGKQQDLTGAMSLWTECFDYRINLDSNDEYGYDSYVSVAEDFQVYFWTGLPRMYYEASPPVA